MVSAKIVIKGMVQLVGFRFYAKRNADALGVNGYVRNLVTGEVEVIAQADEKILKSFIELLKKGPSAAIVEDVAVEYDPDLDENFTDFRIR